MELTDFPDEFLLCRDISHSWDPYSAQVGQNKTTRRREVRQVFLCVRCGSAKTRVMSPGGEILRSSYTYPQGYLRKDQGRLSPADRAMIRRINLAAYLKTQKDGGDA